ncbi:MAG TPA: hypothetical protein VK826_07445 [Bacteroidia bacterium]|nr:hypothetical protein [Bacteroidia bacterium]
MKSLFCTGALFVLISIFGISFAAHSPLSSGHTDQVQITTSPEAASITSEPPICKLPFGPPIRNIDSLSYQEYGFGFSLIGTNLYDNPQLSPSYKLPEIKTVKYTVVDTSMENYCSKFNSNADSFFVPQYYKCRLPDFKSFSVYYISDWRRGSPDSVQGFRKYCSSFSYEYYGYLGLYEPLTQQMSLIRIFHDRYIDSQQQRFFYINSKYNIFLTEVEWAEAECGAERMNGYRYEITINDDASLNILRKPPLKIEPAIRQLPFGPAFSNTKKLCNASGVFYSSMIGTNLGNEAQYTCDYYLPEITSVKYTVVDSMKEGRFCAGEQSIDSFFMPTTSKCRLPDFKSFQVYYISNGQYAPGDFYTPDFVSYCDEFAYDYYGYLGVYDTLTRQLHVIPIYYERYRDSQQQRSFYIDKNYKIFICDTGYAEGEEGAERMEDQHFEITINDDAGFTILRKQ